MLRTTHLIGSAMDVSPPLIPLIVMVLAALVTTIAAIGRPAGPRTDRPKSTLARDGAQGGAGLFLATPDRAAR